MRRILFVLCISAACFCHEAKAQWVVTDPGNLAQGIINSAKQIIQTSTTANNTLNGFKETAKVFEQGKKYYDALKSVHNLVKDARKVQQTVLLVGDISEMYVTNYQKMLSDPNFTPGELNAIAFEKIKPGGILFTFSCSQVVSKENFRLAVFSAAAQSGRSVRILHQLTQPADHPVNIYHPEGEYLKGLVLYVE